MLKYELLKYLREMEFWQVLDVRVKGDKSLNIMFIL